MLLYAFVSCPIQFCAVKHGKRIIFPRKKKII